MGLTGPTSTSCGGGIEVSTPLDSPDWRDNFSLECARRCLRRCRLVCPCTLDSAIKILLLYPCTLPRQSAMSLGEANSEHEI